MTSSSPQASTLAATVSAFLLQRLVEPSTWAGASAFLAALASQYPQAASVLVTMATLSAAAAVGLKERGGKKA